MNLFTPINLQYLVHLCCNLTKCSGKFLKITELWLGHKKELKN